MKADSLGLAALVALASSVAGCDSSNNAPPQTPPSPSAPGPGGPPATSAPATTSGAATGPAAPLPAGAALPKPSTTDAGALPRASNAFAFDLHRTLAKRGGNIAVSPASISTALAMTWGGAVGATSDQMRKTLHLEGTVEQVLSASGKLVADLQSSSAPILAIASRLFGEKTYTFQKPFLERTEKLFGAPLEPVDFTGAPEAARKHVNDWVASKTKDRIKDLVPPRGIDDETRLTLVNAVYFLGDWEQPFDKRFTKPVPFHVDGQAAKPVTTMCCGGGLPFAKVEGTQLIELPYVGARFAMLVAVPAEPDGLPALEASLDVGRYERWVEALAPEQVVLSLPKFEVDPTEAIALRDPLLALGMKVPFDRDHADFTRIAHPPTPEDRLFLGNVFHKAFVKVDEKGTEAAAATAVVTLMAGYAPPKIRIREVTVDRPFLFFLRDRQTGIILFAGRVVDPTRKG